MCVCGYGVDHMVNFGGLFHFSCSVVIFIFVLSMSEDVAGLLGTFPRYDHIDRVHLGVRGYRSNVTGHVQHL